MQRTKQRRRRRRGVILSPIGLQKFQAAKTQAEFIENGDRRFTLEALSERTGVSTDTLMKVFACESGVDKQTLRQCFRAFALVLETQDYAFPEPLLELESCHSSGVESTLPTSAENPPPLLPELPEGQVPLHSPFYVERPPVEASCYHAITQAGALIRIKAPRQMGKSSLLMRILHQANQLGYCSVSLGFQLADKGVFLSLDAFLRWFCANIGLALQLPNRMAEFWDDLFGSKVSCKMYFEHYLLKEISQPLVLGLDGVDELFQYPQIASEFFALLRTWHEEAKSREIWQKLRLVVVHSMEVLLPLNVNQSPFNVGLPVELLPFTPTQITALAQQHQINCSSEQIDLLFSLVAGHPYLTRLAFFHFQHRQLSFHQWALSASTPSGIYGEHLQKKLWLLQQEPELWSAFQTVVTASQPVELPLNLAFKLQSMGLTRLQANQTITTCQLYTRYFRSFFRS